MTDSTLTEFLKEMNRMRSEMLTDEEFSMAKSVMSGNFARQLENPETVARYALNTARYKLPYDYYGVYLKNLAAVTKQDIQEMARKYLRPENAHIVVVGNKDEVAEKLARFAKSGKVNFYDFAGTPVSDSGASMPDGVTVETVIADYFEAMGGKAAMEKVTSMQSVMNADMQGMTIESKMYQKAPTMSVMEIGMNGQVMQKMVYNGEKGFMEAMGQKQEMPKQMLDRYAVGYIFPELHYEKIGAKAELAGMESIDGKNAYKVNVAFANGQKSTDYFAQESSLKIRSITTEQGQTQTSDFSDYKEVDGIMIPHLVTISGTMPMTLEMKMMSVKINGEVAEDMFKVD